MMKTGAAAAVIAIASLSAAVTAQDAGSCGAAWARCKGPEPGDNVGCCEGLQCVEKNEFYAQCRPANKPVPEEWPLGTVLAEKSPGVTADDIADDEDPAADGDDLGELGEDDENAYDVDDLDAEDMEEDIDGLVESLPDEDADEEPMEEMLDTEGPMDDDEDMGDDEDEYMLTYMTFVGKDYHPAHSTDGGVAVEDIPGGSAKVASPMECEDLCTDTEGCNAASYYLDGSQYGGKNCWLKSLDFTCELPMGAVEDENAVYIMQVDAACEEEDALSPMGLAMGPGMAPMEAMGPDAAAPGGVDLDDEDGEDASGDSIPRVAPGEVEDDDAGAVHVGGAMIALLVAGAAAIF